MFSNKWFGIISRVSSSIGSATPRDSLILFISSSLSLPLYLLESLVDGIIMGVKGWSFAKAV